MLNIILMGPQGSGKGTQAKKLADQYDLDYIEAGKILRKLAQKKDQIGQKINRYLLKGTLVPTAVLIDRVLKPHLQKLQTDKGVVFDGVPRRLIEAKALEKMLNSLGRRISQVFYVQISEDETYERLGKRLTCKACSCPYIAGVDVESFESKCPQCGGSLYQRADDTLQAIQKRLEIFRRETLPVINYFRGQGIVAEINGEQKIEAVQQDIEKKIKLLIDDSIKDHS